ncbi:MAG: SRPBCC family protein [Bacteroidia bacterium]|nr:SRPBCC family protein [Bacteroidia bacterium]
MLFPFLLLGGLPASPVNPQNNKHFSHSITTAATPAAIWTVWTEVNKWQNWDSGLSFAMMKGPFELGAKGTITSLEGRKSTFRVVEIEQGSSYTFKTNLPLGGLYVRRSLTTENGLTTFTHEVWFTGLSGGLFARQFGPKFRAMLPGVMEAVVNIAEGM